MKVVIDIPDEWKIRIECNRRPNTIECGQLVESIWKGKVLPKGHGRLIDADKLLQQTLYNPLHVPYISEEDVLNAPTIIEENQK